MATSQSSVAQETDNRPVTHLWFTTEIQHMMFGFGDCSRPLVESATLIEEIVFQQMSQLLYQVEVIAHRRGARLIGIEDFLFLLRKNKMRLHRLLRFLEFKDVRTAAIKSVGFDEDEAAVEDPKLLQVRKRRKTCQEFLGIIDSTGELIALMDDAEDDEIRRERKMRAEMLTRNMTTQQYLEYSEARQASFTPRYRLQKFKEWVLSGVELDIKPNPFALEILSYMAYETVAEIVDLALIVKRDKNAPIGDPFGQGMALVNMNYETLTSRNPEPSAGSLLSPSLSSTNTLMSPQTPKASSAGNPGASPFGSTSSINLTNKAKKRKVVSQQTRDLITAQAITPEDIYEALRRFCAPIGPFADFSKMPLISVSQRLLSC